jgi:hypothetical protein
MKDCTKYSGGIVLQEHQKKLVNFISSSTEKGILAFHSVGSGKTITSLAAARCLLEKFPFKRVQIITNTSLTSNFLREIDNLKLDFKNKIQVDSYAAFISKSKKGKVSCADTVLIVDESQGINGQGSSRFKWVFECAQMAPKVILLSATPIKNYQSEFANQLSLITGEKVGKAKLDAIEELTGTARDKAYKKLLGCKVSYFKRDPNGDPNYPTVKQNIVVVKMSKEYYEEYLKVQNNIKEGLPTDFMKAKNLAVFYNGIRRAVNKVDDVSPKIKWVIKKIQEDITNNKKVLVYSTWLSSGIVSIKKILAQNGIHCSEVSGRIAKEDKDAQVSRYNRGLNKVMLISSSGAEGLNLKETRTVIVLEPHWNQSRIDQVIGRAVRYKSHSKLPENERLVEVFHLILVKNPKYTKTYDKTDSADSILLKLTQQKEENIQKFYSSIAKVSIENDSTC